MENLPGDIFLHLSKYLSLSELSKLALTCKYLNELYQSDTFWKYVYNKEYMYNDLEVENNYKDSYKYLFQFQKKLGKFLVKLYDLKLNCDEKLSRIQYSNKVPSVFYSHMIKRNPKKSLIIPVFSFDFFNVPEIESEKENIEQENNLDNLNYLLSVNRLPLKVKDGDTIFIVNSYEKGCPNYKYMYSENKKKIIPVNNIPQEFYFPRFELNYFYNVFLWNCIHLSEEVKVILTNNLTEGICPIFKNNEDMIYHNFYSYYERESDESRGKIIYLLISNRIESLELAKSLLNCNYDIDNRNNITYVNDYNYDILYLSAYNF